MAKRLDPDLDWDGLVRSYKTHPAIAKHLGCSPHSVYLHLRKRGLDSSPKRKLRDVDSGLLLSMYQKHRSTEVLGRCFGVSRYTIRSEFRRRGLGFSGETYAWTQEALEELYITRGLGSGTIASMYGSSQGAVLFAFRRYGIPTRPRGSVNYKEARRRASLPGALDMPTVVHDDDASHVASPGVTT